MRFASIPGRVPPSGLAEAARLQARLGREWRLGLVALAAILLLLVRAGSEWRPALAALIGFAGAYAVFRLKQHDEALGRLRLRLEDQEATAGALLAEIETNIRYAERSAIDAPRILARMRADQDWLPFFTVDPQPGLVYRAMLPKLPQLPLAVVGPVVAYHDLDASVNEALRTTRGADFARLAPERRHAYVGAALDLYRETYVAPPEGEAAPRAGAARQALQAYLGEVRVAIARLRHLQARSFLREAVATARRRARRSRAWLRRRAGWLRRRGG